MWLLDTNVISEIGRPKPNAAVVRFVSSQPVESLYLSSIVLAELRSGVDLLTDPERRQYYADWLSQTVRPIFGTRVIEVTEDSIVRWILLVRDARKRGRTYPEPDLLLGSVALQAGMTLVTRNTADFEGSGVDVLNPWGD